MSGSFLLTITMRCFSHAEGDQRAGFLQAGRLTPICKPPIPITVDRSLARRSLLSRRSSAKEDGEGGWKTKP
jgi:hypothetical protein